MKYCTHVAFGRIDMHAVTNQIAVPGIDPCLGSIEPHTASRSVTAKS